MILHMAEQHPDYNPNPEVKVPYVSSQGCDGCSPTSDDPQAGPMHEHLRVMLRAEQSQHLESCPMSGNKFQVIPNSSLVMEYGRRSSRPISESLKSSRDLEQSKLLVPQMENQGNQNIDEPQPSCSSSGDRLSCRKCNFVASNPVLLVLHEAENHAEAISQQGSEPGKVFVETSDSDDDDYQMNDDCEDEEFIYGYVDVAQQCPNPVIAPIANLSAEQTGSHETPMPSGSQENSDKDVSMTEENSLDGVEFEHCQSPETGTDIAQSPAPKSGSQFAESSASETGSGTAQHPTPEAENSTPFASCHDCDPHLDLFSEEEATDHHIKTGHVQIEFY